MRADRKPLFPAPSLERITVVARAIAEAAGLRLVVLFGSAARREPSPRDVDVGILARSSGTPDLLDLTSRFIAGLGTNAVDVVDLARANPVLLMAVARDGCPVYQESESDFAEFSSLAMRRYADTKKFRDALRDDLRAFAGLPDGQS